VQDDAGVGGVRGAGQGVAVRRRAQAPPRAVVGGRAAGTPRAQTRRPRPLGGPLTVDTTTTTTTTATTARR
jgi:hypothetical protein